MLLHGVLRKCESVGIFGMGRTQIRRLYVDRSTRHGCTTRYCKKSAEFVSRVCREPSTRGRHKKNWSRECRAGCALRAASHRPHRSPYAQDSWQLVARLCTPDPTRHKTLGWTRTRPTHAHGWAGGCCVVGSPTGSPLSPPLRGPEAVRRRATPPLPSDALLVGQP